jgi:glycosyltransferase involved in cell wall biosynthesis
MDKCNNIDISVIIPVYNVEKYLPECIESVLNQGKLRQEVILVNDGSTDQSGTIADQYARQDSRIKVVHKENGGASSARNVGLELAQGAYIAFVDSDDWVKESALSELYCEAVRYQADVVMGNVWLCFQDGGVDKPFKRVTNEILNNVLSGKEGFSWLVKTRFYLPLQVKYIYRRKFLKKIQAQFEEGIIHEDELWTPVVLYHAERMVITGIDFYYYRQNRESVMHTTSLIRRLNSLFQVISRLIEFADRFDFSGEDSVFRNWLYVNIFRIYSTTFNLVSSIKNSSIIIPPHHLDRFWKDCWEMIPESQKICKHFYQLAEIRLKKYTDWRMSEWVASIAPQIKAGEKLMLVYNSVWDENLSLKIEDVPSGWVITTDRRYFQQADVIVFHLPDLLEELENDLNKPEGQIWASLYLNSENYYAWINDTDISELFDFWIIYQQDPELKKEHPLIELCRTIEKKTFEMDNISNL